MRRSLLIRSVLAAGGVMLAAWWVLSPGFEDPGHLVWSASPQIDAKVKQVRFNRDILPILSDRCFACHGPDDATRESGLRLDLQESLFAPLPKNSDKRAFVPGKPEESYAYQRMISTDPQVRMPPVTSHLSLNEKETELVRLWIEQGAQWENHWAFNKPERPEVPEVRDSSWPRNEIDRFILARLEEEGIAPSPEADKATLIRRLSLDLIGLPPTPPEVDAFLADDSADAYEKLVDRLLASPHYGEHMAAMWLDGARFADSHGYQSDPERFMHHWRDWVINAFNSNMPFDQFTIEQLAGDLLPEPTEAQKIATGFNRNHRMNSEGGIIDEEWRVEGVIDRVETTGTVFLGLTLGCARCHDHKYDPISQKEFYAFSAFFNSNNERGEFYSIGLDQGKNAPPLMKVFTPELQQRMAELKAKVAAAEAGMAKLHERLPEFEQAFKESGASLAEPDGLIARFTLDETHEGVGVDGKTIPATFEGAEQPTYVDGKIGKALKITNVESVDAGQALSFEHTDAFSYGAWVNLEAPNGTILSKMEAAPGHRGFDIFLQDGRPAPHLVGHWPSQRAIKVVSKNQLPMNAWVHVMVTYDGSSKAAGLKVYINGQVQEVTVEADRMERSIKTKKAPLLIGRRIDNSSPMKGAVDDVRFYSRELSAAEVAALATGPDLSVILPIAESERTDEQKALLARILLSPLPEYASLDAEKTTAAAELAKIDNDPRNTTMIMEELPEPRETFVLLRGEYDKHGEKVEHATPSVLPPLPEGAPVNRLGLAQWIVDESNPLTARVQANRLWEKFFGHGIVKTSENFGMQASWPSHPELLDWLATELIERKWDLKALQKMIVMSATYRQSSNMRPELMERDPENRLLARHPRLRLPAEAVRDQALVASGLLAPRIGGPSVKPYQPEDLWAGNLFGNLGKYVVDSGENLYRRSLYTFIKRTALPANLMAFDMPSREYCIVKRSRTNTPLQALDTLNDPTYIEAARVLAERMMKEGGPTPQTRIVFAFRRTVGRLPNAAELEILEQQYQSQLERYRGNSESATQLLSVGAHPRDEALDPAELAAYTMTASVLLNLDEIINKP